MNQKTLDYLTNARTWLEKNSGGDVDMKPAQQALDAAEKVAREVAELKSKLAAASKEKRIAMLVLEETLKSAKHARRARAAREKPDKKAVKATTKTDPNKKR